MLAAISWAAASICLRRALQTTNALTASFASVVVNAILLWPVAVVTTRFETIGLEAVIALIAAGLVAPALGRLLRFIAVDMLGVAPAAPLVAIGPVFTAVLAVLFLGEVVTLQIGLGTAAVVAGVMLLSLRRGSLKLSRMGVFLSLVSAATFGGGDVLRKFGATLSGSPIIGAAIGVTVAAPVYMLLSKIIGRPLGSYSKWNRFNLANGVFTGLAIALTFVALYYGRVVVVEPLISTAPLFTLLLTAVYLKGLERVTSTVAMSAVLIFMGSVLVATS